MDKLIHDDKGNATISNDGANIMKLLDVVHPAAKILVDIAKSQESEVGDGTTRVVLFAEEFLKEAKLFIYGVHSKFSQHEKEASGHEQHAKTRGTQGVQVDYGYVQQYDKEQENSPTDQVLGKDGLGSGDEACVSRQTREVCDSRQTREVCDIGQNREVCGSRQTREVGVPRQTREEELIHQTESVAAELSPHLREENLIISRNGDSLVFEKGVSTSESLSRIHTTSVGLNIADSKAEKVLHLLVQKQQVRELESKPPDPTSPQSSNWSDMIEEEVDDQLQISKERYKPQWQLESHTLPTTRSRSRSRTKGRDK
ncbi:hypothetical protein IFM89_019125 [Coptis chinensis]|uniref:T-complex protein 1 subunit eta n=1 Tax=Coptis chinensis TaxID=261450 RepID=A0A835HUA4_9MAGN|nr:hypothetical protein IFM89_019125 [Coptis chinensis]